MKRLLLTSYAFSPSVGGLEAIGGVLARGLAADYEVTVLTDTPDAALSEPDALPYRIVRRPSLRRLIVESWRADVVLQNHLSLRLGMIAIACGRPSVVTLQTWLSDDTLFARLLQRLTLRRAAVVVACSQAVADTLSKPAVTIHNAYDDRVFKDFGRPDREGIAFVGRLVPDKGLLVLLAAYLLLVPEVALPTLHIVGSGPLLEGARVFVAAHQLEQHVAFHGSLPPIAVNEILNRCAVHVVPSTWEEPFGIVALEGLAAGCHVIATTVGGLPEAAGKDATLVPPQDVEGLASALREALAVPWAPPGAGVAEHLVAHQDAALVSAYRTVLDLALTRKS